MFQSLNGAIDSETLGNPSEIDNHWPSKSNVACVFEHDVAPAAIIQGRFEWRQIIPFDQLPRSCDVENAIALARKFLRTFQDMPRQWMNLRRFIERVAIDPRNVA